MVTASHSTVEELWGYSDATACAVVSQISITVASEYPHSTCVI